MTMLTTGSRPACRQISYLIRSTKRSPSGIKRREAHSTPPRDRPRRSYTVLLLTLPLVAAALYGVYSRQSFVLSRVIPGDVDAPSSVSDLSGEDGDGEDEDVDEVTGEEEVEDEEEVGADEEEPLEDFTAYPPPMYTRHFWPRAERTTEEELSFHSRIFKVDFPCGIARYDIAVVPSGMNPACFSSSHYTQLPSHYWFLFGIYDGHNGNVIASHLSRSLPHAIVNSLVDLYSKHATLYKAHVDVGNGPDNQDYWSGRVYGRPYPPPEDFDASVRQAFNNIDRDIVHTTAERSLEAAARYWKGIPNEGNQLSYENAASLLSGAHCGSSAMVAVYESDTRQLRLANTGNSRAVLGRCVVDDKGVEMYEVHVLAHELDVPAGFVDDPPSRRFRVRGSSSSNLHSFGDGPWKWSKDTRQDLNDAFPFIVDSARPYAEVTERPDIITFEAQPGDFLVMGSRGLWSSLSHEEAIGLVGLWLKRYRKVVYGDWMIEERDIITVYDPETSTIVHPSSKLHVPSTEIRVSITSRDVFSRRDLPVQVVGKRDDTFMYQLWGLPKKFVLADRNAAQHLVRNALGGANAEMVDALLSMRRPRSRNFRDDVSVQVIFFK